MEQASLVLRLEGGLDRMMSLITMSYGSRSQLSSKVGKHAISILLTMCKKQVHRILSAFILFAFSAIPDTYFPQEYGTASHLSRIAGVAKLLLNIAAQASLRTMLNVIEVLEHICTHEKIAKEALDANVLLFAQTQIRSSSKLDPQVVCSLLRLLRQLATTSRGCNSISMFGGFAAFRPLKQHLEDKPVLTAACKSDINFLFSFFLYLFLSLSLLSSAQLM